jgi:hypothetical protein
LRPKDELHRAPNDNPPRNIISEGTPNDLPDRNNIRTPAPQPKFEGSNPAGYGALRDGVASRLKQFRQASEQRMFHKFLKWQTLNQAGRGAEIKNEGARQELQNYNQIQQLLARRGRLHNFLG